MKKILLTTALSLALLSPAFAGRERAHTSGPVFSDETGEGTITTKAYDNGTVVTTYADGSALTKYPHQESDNKHANVSFVLQNASGTITHFITLEEECFQIVDAKRCITLDQQTGDLIINPISVEAGHHFISATLEGFEEHYTALEDGEQIFKPKNTIQGANRSGITEFGQGNRTEHQYAEEALFKAIYTVCSLYPLQFTLTFEEKAGTPSMTFSYDINSNFAIEFHD